MAPGTDEVLRRLLDEGRVRAAAADPAQARLWDELATAAEGGKRFRPALVLAAHEALGGRRMDAAIQVGAAVQLLHAAFVIHDDVIDGDDVRRGRLNVSGTFRAEALSSGAAPDDASGLGRAAGILAGDLALAAAVRAVATCGAPPDVVALLLDLVDSALHITSAGELADVRLSLGVETVSLAESLVMEEQKTSAYSFSLPLQAGAVLAGAGERVVDGLGAVGRDMGVAFQLADDLVGVFGDPAVTGKSTTSDLRTRKQTPLLVHARSTPEWTRIRPYVGRDLTDAELVEVRRLLTTSGSRRFVEDLAESRLSTARAVLADLEVSIELPSTLAAHPPVLDGSNEVAA
jgi:geranylgeranyl diphosphate synthase type II